MRVFRAVAECGGFSAAATALGASQPFVSQTVQRLEARLGVALIDRTTRTQRLTAEGERYLAAARAAVEAVDLADAALQEEAGRIAGTLRVSAPLAFGLDRVTPLLAPFLERHPHVDLRLLLTDDAVDLIEARVDVAVRMGRLADSALACRRLCGLQRVVVAAPALLERHGRPAVPADLARLPVLCWDGAREHLNRWPFRVDGEPWTFHAEGRFRSNEGMSLFAMCTSGFGAMRCAEHLARPAIRTGALVPLLEDFAAPDDGAVYAVFHPHRTLLPRVRAFLDHLAGAFGQEW